MIPTDILTNEIRFFLLLKFNAIVMRSGKRKFHGKYTTLFLFIHI